MATNSTHIDRLRDIVRRDMDLILAFLAQDEATAIGHLVRFSQSQGIGVTASEISAALAAKRSRLQTLATQGHGIALGHNPSTAFTTPW